MTPTASDGFEPLIGADATSTLQSYRWRLESATQALGKPVEGLFPPSSPPITFVFESGMVVVHGACNTLRGSYMLDAAGQLVVGRLASTMKACEPGLMQADAALAKRLATAQRASVAKNPLPKLRLETASSESMVLAGEPTPEARHGAPTLMFLEVSAWRVPCAPASSSDARCLRVRERFFDERGLPSGPPGEWRVLADSIAGYTHREGEHTVLRVKRFESASTPAASSQFLYVLDLLVQTNVASPDERQRNDARQGR